MTQKLLLTLITFFINIVYVSAQDPTFIEKTASNVFLSLTQNKSLPISELDKLHAILNSEIKDIKLEEEYFTTRSLFDSLRNHFILFEKECKNISSDSALFLFNQWYLHFNNVFYKYRKAEFFSSHKKKILLFSTSMSCYCTLEMCKNQTVEILNLIFRKGSCPCLKNRTNIEDIDFLVVDSYKNNELPIKYEALFSPSVVFLDEENKLLLKIEYEKDMIKILKDFLIEREQE